MGERIRLLVGSDSAGFDYKDAIFADMKSDDRVESVEDLGVYAGALKDGTYPSVAIAAGEKIMAGEADRAILLCGTGIGVAIAANKVPGIRATVAHDSFSVERPSFQRLPDPHLGTAGDRFAAGPAAGAGMAGLPLRSEQPLPGQCRRDRRVEAPHRSTQPASAARMAQLSGVRSLASKPSGERSVTALRAARAGSRTRAARLRPARAAAARTGRESADMPRVRILVVDNYDSFVYNLVQYLAQIGAEVEVWRNDDERFADPGFVDGFDGILLSPGPGSRSRPASVSTWSRTTGGRAADLRGVPGSAGHRRRVRRGGRSGSRAAARQDIADHARGRRRAGRAALAVHRHALPLARHRAGDAAGRAGGDRHHAERSDHGGPAPQLPVEAVQFHPESVLTEGGYQMLANWLAICGDAEAPGRAVGLAPLMSAG